MQVPEGTEARIVLVRHGETEWSSQGRHTGTTDIPLTDAGEAEAAQIGRVLAGRSFGVVLASPLARATHTAAGARLDFQIESNLAEWDYGVFEGKTTPEIAAELGAEWSIWRPAAPGEPAPAESAAEVGERAEKVLNRIAPVLERGDDVALVAHAHLLRILTARWLGLNATDGAMFALDAGSISELGFEHGCPVIWSWNSTP